MSGVEAFIVANPWIGTAAAVAGGVASAAGSLSAGQSQSNMAKYNAAVSEREAAQAREAAKFEEARNRKASESLLSSQRAAFAKGGVTSEGSPLLVQAETAEEAEIDALALRYSGSVAEARAKSQAALDRMQGRAAKTTGYIGAGSSLLSGASSAFRRR